MTTTTALCATPGTDPELWHSTHPKDQERAVKICRACPLRDACAQWAADRDEPYGTWGGTTEAERHHVRRRRAMAAGAPDPGPDPLPAPVGKRPRCGTHKAFLAHVRNGETCVTCWAALAARTEQRRRVQLADEHAKGGTQTGAEIHRRLGEPACGPCRSAVNAYQNAKRRARRQARRQAAA